MPPPRFRLPPLLRTTLSPFLTLLTYLPVGIFLNDNYAQLMWVNGPSMYPVFNAAWYTHGHLKPDMVFMDMRRAWQREKDGGLKRGELVAFWSPRNPENVAIKRIIALEGDVVATRAPYPFVTETVPLGHVWVEGEHPEGRMTLDSNTYGPIAKSLIAGKVKGIVLPLDKAGMTRWEDYKGNARVIEGDGPYEVVR